MRTRNCLFCNEIIEGRSDKKFCNKYCRSSHHNDVKARGRDSLFVRIDKQLKLNRRLLHKYTQSGFARIKMQTLNIEGFNGNYFTHYWKNGKGEVYLFCYEYGFLKLRNHDQYILIKWQEYMAQKTRVFDVDEDYF